ncbi:MAG: CPBP family intramembrane glutamic endopeptidase [Isosphaeraceae bacterium]
MTERMLAITFINMLTVLVVPVLVHLISGATLIDLGLNTHNLLRNLWAGTVAFFLVTPWVYLVFGLARLIYPATRHPLETMLREEKSSLAMVLAVFSAVVAAPLAEELLFRGIFQSWLNRIFLPPVQVSSPVPSTPGASSPTQEVDLVAQLDKGPPPETDPGFEWVQSAEKRTSEAMPTEGEGDQAHATRRRRMMPIGLTSLLFAGVHFTEMPAPVAIFVLSLALGVLYQRTGSLVASITLHALFNALSTLQLFLTLS